MTDHRNPVDQAVEYAVYAPLGFALEAKRLLPTFVDRGRAQVQMAKMIGQFAVTKGQEEALVRLADAQAKAEGFLAEMGLRNAGASTSAAGATDGVVDVEADPAEDAPVPVRSSAASAELPISDYDSLAASQVIPRLEGLEADELDAVRRYETAHRGRKTILGKIAQLQGE